MTTIFKSYYKKTKLKSRKSRTKVKLNQDELLAEAALTEKLNARSLDYKYKQQLQKEVQRIVNREESRVKLISTTFPLLEGTDSENEDGGCKKSTSQSATTSSSYHSSSGVYARNFVVCGDHRAVQTCFPSSGSPHSTARSFSTPNKVSQIHGKACVITGLPAKYMDPLTNLPYATVHAFRIIRENYYNKVKSMPPDEQRSPDINSFANSYSKTNASSSHI